MSIFDSLFSIAKKAVSFVTQIAKRIGHFFSQFSVVQWCVNVWQSWFGTPAQPHSTQERQPPSKSTPNKKQSTKKTPEETQNKRAYRRQGKTYLLKKKKKRISHQEDKTQIRKQQYMDALKAEHCDADPAQSWARLHDSKQQLGDENINSFFAALCRGYNQSHPQMDQRVGCLNTFIPVLVDSPTYPSHNKKSPQAEAKLFKAIKRSKATTVFMPVHIPLATQAGESDHWGLAIIHKRSPGNVVIYGLDGLNMSKAWQKTFLPHIKYCCERYLFTEACHIDTHHFPVAQQDNLIDCGAVIGFWAKYFLDQGKCLPSRDPKTHNTTSRNYSYFRETMMETTIKHSQAKNTPDNTANLKKRAAN